MKPLYTDFEYQQLRNKAYIVTMPDESRWSIPVAVIAFDRAKHYREEFNNSIQESLNEDTIPLFNSDKYEIHDWASNNMNWEDVREYATQEVGAIACDYQEGWVNGDYELSRPI